MARRQLELSNEVAAELAGRAGPDPAHARGASGLRDLPARQRRHARRRGRRGAGRARPWCASCPRWSSAGTSIGPATIESVTRVLDERESPAAGARGRRLAPPQPAGRAEVGQPEALRRRDPPLDDHLRHRPRGHRQDVPGDRDGRRRALAPRGQPHHPHAPGRRGRRAPRLPARRPDGEGRPLPAPAVRRAARHARRRAGRRAPRARRDRGRAAGLHARPHAQRLVRDPRRGAEHEPRADEDVPDPPRLRLEDGRHRRHHAGRPAARPEVGPARGRRTSSTDVEGVEFVRFGGEDVVRHKLVQRIVAAYDEHCHARGAASCARPSRITRRRTS